MKKLIPTIALLILVVSCKESATKKEGPEKQFDKLEKVFQAGNWRHINYEDTAYLFFSREGSTSYKIFRYRMLNGDSVNTAVFNIQMQNDTIVLKVENDTRVLVQADENGSSWDDEGTVYQFQKIDTSHILLKKDGEITDTLMRTLPISTFLVRSKYDFIHGTRTADSTRESN